MKITTGTGIGLAHGRRKAFSPIEYSPALWLDASNAGSRYKERTGPTNLATATGDPVGTLMDLSGNGRHVVASTDADRPTYRPAEGMGGKPSLQFDGGGDRLVNDAIGSLFSGSGVGWTIFVVGQQTNTTRYAISFGNSSSTTTTMYFTFVDGSSQSLLLVRNDANQSTSRTIATSATATPYICCLNYTGSAVTLRRNGTESASGSLGGAFTYDRFAVGTLRRVTESETSFLGYLSEVIIYPPLSSSNILSVERYLAEKWMSPPVVTLTASSTIQHLEWDAVPMATGYEVYYKLSSSSSWVLVTTTTSLWAVVQDLAVGSTYDYRVDAIWSV